MQQHATKKLSRRDVLRGGGGLVAMTVMPAGLILGANNAWAATAKAVKPETFASMVQACRDIYPHDFLDDSFYAKVVEGFDSAAAGDADATAVLENGVAAMNKAAQSAHGADYMDLGWEDDRTSVLRAMQDDPFFQKMRGALVTGIYANPDVWPLFGYEGESASKGGYINRGFDDIDWLDQV